MGGVLFSTIQLGADIGDTISVDIYRERYAINSIHWLECDTFSYGDSTISIYNPMSKLVTQTHYDSINDFFPIKIQSDNQSEQKSKIIYWGGLYVEGKGHFHGHIRHHTKQWDDIDK
jgi:hypothetical protein